MQPYCRQEKTLEAPFRNLPSMKEGLLISATQMNSDLKRTMRAFLGNPTGLNLGTGSERDREDSAIVLTGRSSTSVSSKFPRDGFTCVQRFALLPSMNATRWWIPLGDPRWAQSAWQIYRPHARRGRLFKKLLLGVTQLSWTGWARHEVLIGSKGPLPLEILASDITGERRPIFALSLGTPGRFRKLTVQIMRPDGEILGYAKLPLTRAATERVRHEATVLNRLSCVTSLRPHVPRIFHAGEWGDGYILVLSNGPSGLGPVEFGPLHQYFLIACAAAHRVDRPGHVLWEETADKWRQSGGVLSSEWRALVQTALEEARQALDGEMIPCGLIHGDFAPWNTRMGNGSLFVFDWESAGWDLPLAWDAFHFHTQVACLLNKNREQVRSLRSAGGKNALLLLYLLNSICQILEENAPDGHLGLNYRRRLLADALSHA